MMSMHIMGKKDTSGPRSAMAVTIQPNLLKPWNHYSNLKSHHPPCAGPRQALYVQHIVDQVASGVPQSSVGCCDQTKKASKKT